MKKVDSVEQESDEKVNFKAQVFWSHRAWEATILDQVPDELIIWRSKGEKGHVDGAVTFHELAPRLTRVVVVLEYYPQGLFERTGNIWRAQGRRARLELKHFKRHVMMNVLRDPNQVEGWRGVIHDSEVERSHEEVVDEEKRQRDAADQQAEGTEHDQDAHEGEEPVDQAGEEPVDEGGEPVDEGDEPVDEYVDEAGEREDAEYYEAGVDEDDQYADETGVEEVEAPASKAR